MSDQHTYVVYHHPSGVRIGEFTDDSGRFADGDMLGPVQIETIGFTLFDSTLLPVGSVIDRNTSVIVRRKPCFTMKVDTFAPEDLREALKKAVLDLMEAGSSVFVDGRTPDNIRDAICIGRHDDRPVSFT